MADWRNLHTLLVFARNETLGATAQALGIDRTTVSRRIESLEMQLGTKLTARVSRDLLLTQAGREAAAAAESMHSEVLNLERRITGRDQHIEGVVRLTTTPAIADLLGQDLARFGRDHPGLLINVNATNKQEDLGVLEADVALRLTMDPPDTLIGQKLAEPAVALYSNKAVAQKIVSESTVDFIGWTLDEQTRAWIHKTLDAEPTLVMQTNAVELMRQLAVSGLGVVLMPCHAGERTAELIRLSEPRRHNMPDLWLLYHPRLRSVRRIRVFAHYMQSVFCVLRPMLEGVSEVVETETSTATT